MKTSEGKMKELGEKYRAKVTSIAGLCKSCRHSGLMLVEMDDGWMLVCKENDRHINISGSDY